MIKKELKNSPILPSTSSIINILGVVYAHSKTEDGGDLYLTRYGLNHAKHLEIGNWYDKDWFTTHREKLFGTSSVFRVPTKPVDGKSIQLVVKNCRVGEDVPIDTHTLFEFINAEFNSPWEEFALVMEMREGKFGPDNLAIKTQRPLAIYVPPERLQLWQTGRSVNKINKITRRHPGINLDILRQYKLVYEWIEGLNIIEAFNEFEVSQNDMLHDIEKLNAKAIHDMENKGYIVADMKPSHVIIGEDNIKNMKKTCDRNSKKQRKTINSLVDTGAYSIIDYELMLRSSEHEEKVKQTRRNIYLHDQRDRFKAAPLPPYLCDSEIFAVPYVHGHAESTGGLLWVVGRHPSLFDFFLPERWRKTPCQQLSQNDIYYTVTKDNVHIVWKISRIGETVTKEEYGSRAGEINERGFNSPFEEFAIAQNLMDNGISTVYTRAIYMTGTSKLDSTSDQSHFDIHNSYTCIDDEPVLREDRDYITIRGYFNGSDSWVASHDDILYTPYDLVSAQEKGILTIGECEKIVTITLSKMKNAGFDGSLLQSNDILIAVDPNGDYIRDSEYYPESHICNFELIRRL